MRHIITFLLFLLVFIAAVNTRLSAQTYAIIDGQYLDKKENAIANALVSYYRDGVVIAEDTTDEEGYFHLDVLLVGLQKPDSNIEGISFQCYPNPFSHQTSLQVTLTEGGVLRIFDLNGSLLDRLELKNPGSYLIRWSGKSVPAGLQLCNLTTSSENKTIKIINHLSGNKGLQLISFTGKTSNPVEWKNTLLASDSITYQKENTTYLADVINLNGDTSFTREGNPGPSITDPIADTTAAEGDTLMWLITDHCYNDETTNNYNTSSPGTWVSGDSLHHVVQSTMTNVLVDIEDITDTLLSCELSFFVSPSGGGNQPPVAEDDTASVDEDQSVSIDVLANDYDPDGNLDPGSVDTTGLLAPSHGQITFIDQATGHMTYEPDPDYSGDDSFEYRVSDSLGLSDVGLVDVTVNEVNDPPNANNDNASTPYETTITIDVVANDNDPDGNIDPTTVDTTALLQPSHGTITNIDDVTGEMTYDPEDGYSGDDEFEYLVYDDGTPALSDTALVTVQVADPNNSPPVAVDDTASVDEDYSVTIDVLANDSDPDGNLDPGSVDTTGLLAPSHGQITNINGTTGHMTYEPDPDYSGTDQFEYRVSDSLGLSDVGLVDVTVNEVNDPPTANNDNANTNEDNSITIDVVANDTDPDGQIDPTTVDTTALLAPSHGQITNIDDVTGEMTYEPDTNWNGTDTFEYLVYDDGTPSLSDTALVTVNIAAVNDPPYEVTPINDPQTINEDNSWVYTVRPTNVDDVDSPTLNYTVDNVVNGNYSVSGDEITITPNPDWNGTIAGIIINASDGQYTTPMTPFDLDVNPVPDAPVAVDDSDSTDEDIPVTIDVLANDYDVDGDLDPTSVENTGLIQPGHGSLSIDGATGQITYTPDPNWNGSDSFEYRVYDLTNLSDVALVNVTVNAINDAPVANPDNETTDYETSVLIPASSNDTDIDGNIVDSTLQINLSGLVNFSNGTGTHDGNGNVDYTPNNGFSGADSAQYIISDDGYPPPAKSDTGWMHVTVNGPSTVPVTFLFKNATQDTLFTSGTSTLYYRKDGWTQDSMKTSNDGSIVLPMLVDETYEVDGRHTEDLETTGLSYSYTALTRPGDLEAFEQRALDDQSSPVNITASEDTINIYKLHNTFPLIDMRDYASKLNGVQEGIRKFDYVNGPDAPFWVDTSDGGQTLTSTQQQWYNEMVTDLNTVPHVYTPFPLQQNANQPSDPHHRCSIDEDNPPTPLNGTSFNSNHEITQSYAMYPLTFSEYSFKIEFFQAIGDLNDVGGDPNILNGSSQNYTLNSTGRDIFSALYLFKPGTKF